MITSYPRLLRRMALPSLRIKDSVKQYVLFEIDTCLTTMLLTAVGHFTRRHTEISAHVNKVYFSCQGNAVLDG